MKERKRGTFWLGVMKALPFLLVALCTAWTIARGGRLNVRQILSYTPDNYWLAAVFCSSAANRITDGNW